MIRSIIKLGVLLIVGIVAYNSFFGTEEEKADAKEIRQKAGKVLKQAGGALLDLGKDGVALLKEEREKFRAGKYDKAVEEVSGVISQIKDKVEESGGALLDQVEDLEKQKEEIAKRLEETKAKGAALSEETKKSLNKDFEKLTEETEEVLKKLDAKN